MEKPGTLNIGRNLHPAFSVSEGGASQFCGPQSTQVDFVVVAATCSRPVCQDPEMRPIPRSAYLCLRMAGKYTLLSLLSGKGPTYSPSGCVCSQYQ